MKKNSKLLPHLNQLYLQKQSYDHHKKKIKQISKRSSIVPLSVSFEKKIPTHEQHQQFLTRMRMKSYRNEQIQSIQQQIRNIKKWKSPFEKAKVFEIRKQNNRLRERIKTSISKLNEKKLSQEYDRISMIRKRISKYEISPQSHKAILKQYLIISRSKKSLQSYKSSQVSTVVRNKKNDKLSVLMKKNFYKREEIIKNRIKQNKLRSVTMFSPAKQVKKQSYFPTQVDEIMIETK